MGTAMIGPLTLAGYRVIGWDIDPGSLAAATAKGVAPAADPRDLAARTSVVLTSLPDGDAVRAVALGDRGLVSGEHTGLLLIDLSTTSPDEARSLSTDLSPFGVSFLDAPVSGGVGGAAKGTLSVMVGGSEIDLNRARPVLAAIGRRVVHCGPVGSGQIAKACNQLIVIATHAVVAEALVLSEKVGADPAKIREALLGGYASSPIMEIQGERMLKRDFAPGGKAIYHAKDIATLRELARGANVRLSTFESAAALMEELIDSGGGDLDDRAVYLIVERSGGPREDVRMRGPGDPAAHRVARQG
jgi:2-hydroxy-3-oxopropionate reductase